MSVRPRRLARRGVVLARGFFFGQLLPEAEVRARIVAAWRPGCAVHATPLGLVLVFREARRVRAEEAPGTPLCPEARDVLSACPIDPDELARVAPEDGALLIPRGGVLHALPCGREEDPAAWIDVSDFARVAVTPLGDPPPPPRAPEPAPAIDVRKALRAPAAAPEMQAMRAALAKEAAPKPAGVAAQALVARALAALASVLSFFGAKPKAPSAGSGPGLAAAPQRPSGPSLFDRIRARLLDLAARLLVLARLASLVARQHSKYLARMMEMFERGDYEQALRHAIPLGGGEGKDDPAPPALLPPKPRADLTIRPGVGAARSALGVGLDLFADLRAMYRRAFERLVARGEIERAAFVLAELLHANEEAVSFLERHGKYRLAAEIAEARGLPAGLVVRQWFLAGDAARALAIALRRGAFADAVARLERSGPDYAKAAAALRLRWADLLASSGAYAAAVDVVWPIEEARPLARRWIDRAIAVGGPIGGRMLARKAALGADVFAEVHAAMGELFDDPSREADAARFAFARALADGPATPEARALARPATRALLGGRAARPLVEALLHFSADAALRTDVRPLLAHAKVPRIRVATAAATELGHRSANSDAWDFGDLKEGGRKSRGGALGASGYFIAVFDGMGGAEVGRNAARMAADAIFETLCRASPDAAPRPRDVLARDLVLAVKEANRRLHMEATLNARMRGAGASVTCAALVDGVLLVAQVGETRAYVYREGALTAITREHSLVNALLDRGELRPEDIDAFPHKNVITMALGLSNEVDPTLTATALQSGDVLLLFTDGMWRLGDEMLASIAEGEEDMPHLAATFARAARLETTHENATCVVARFTGEDLPASLHGPPAALPFEPAPASLADAGEPSLLTRTSPRFHERARADAGSIAIRDAARLPDGRFVVALGEAGARLLAPDGRGLVHFAQPAHALVVSDHGDRAILVADRGEAKRLAKIDLAGRRVRAWCDGGFRRHATSFDGELFFIARGRDMYAIDAISDGWDAVWTATVDGAVAALERHGSNLEAVVQRGKQFELWRYSLPDLALRNRIPQISVPALPTDAAWRIDYREASSFADVFLHERQGIVNRVHVRLGGAKRAGARLYESEVIVWDDTGRLLAIELRTGGITRELRLTA